MEDYQDAPRGGSDAQNWRDYEKATDWHADIGVEEKKYIPNVSHTEGAADKEETTKKQNENPK